MNWLGIILAFMFGGMFGVVSMCFFIMSGQEDRKPEKYNQTKNK